MRKRNVEFTKNVGELVEDIKKQDLELVIGGKEDNLRGGIFNITKFNNCGEIYAITVECICNPNNFTITKECYCHK